jgi:hypothetical protein
MCCELLFVIEDQIGLGGWHKLPFHVIPNQSRGDPLAAQIAVGGIVAEGIAMVREISILLLDAVSENTIGLIAQQHWCRDRASYGKKHTCKRRAYEDKESYK